MELCGFYLVIIFSGDDHVAKQVAGANRRWRGQFRYRGSRRESAVAQLFSLGDYTTRNNSEYNTKKTYDNQ